MLKVVLIFILAFGAVVPARGQTTEEKRATANRIFAEAVRLVEEGTTESRREAITKFAAALRLNQETGDKIYQAYCLGWMGNISYLLGENQKALEYYNQALPLYRIVADKKSEAATLAGLSLVYLALGEKQRALEFYDQALSLQRAIGDKSGESKTLANLAFVYDNSGDKQKALDYYHQALALQRTLNNKLDEAATLTAIGAIYDTLGERLKALDARNRALPIYQSIGDKNGEAATLANIGSVFIALGENRKALEFYERALPLQKMTGNKIGEARTLGSLGLAYWNLGESQKALEVYNRALSLQRTIHDQPSEAMTLGGIGAADLRLGEYQQALDYFNRALSLQMPLGDRNGEAVTRNNIGSAYWGLGEYRQASDYFNQALLIERATGEKATQGSTLNNIGSVYLSSGEYQKALDYFNQALPLQRAIGDRNGEASTLNNIGSVYLSLGKYQQALDYYDQVLPLCWTIGNKFCEASTLASSAVVYAKKGENQRALDYLNQALPLYQAVGDRSGEASTLSNIGSVYDNQGEREKALDYYEQALLMRRSIGDKYGEASTLHNMGTMYVRIGERQKALESYNQALLLSRAVGDKSGEASTLGDLQYTWQSLGNSRLAVFYGKQAVNHYQELRQAIQSLDVETQKTYLKTVEPTYRALAELLISEGRFSQAEQILRMLKEEEYFDFVRRDSDEIKNLSQRVPLNDKERKLIERYTLLADRVTEIGQKLQKLQDKKARLSRYNLELPAGERKQLDELSAQIADANAAFTLFLEKELVAELGRERTKEVEVDRNLQDKLREWGAGTVALYTVMGEERYRVILTTPTVQVDGKTEIKAAKLNKKIFAFREALQDQGADPRALGKELYDDLIKPIERELQAADAKTLVWSLDGTLRYIPLAALSPDGHSYLVEKYQNVIITPKTRDDVSTSNRDWRALGLGVSTSQSVADPDRPNEKISFIGLPGTKTELMAIVRDEQTPTETGVLTGKRFLDEGFTTKALTDSLAKETKDGRRKYTLIHIASHFRLGSNWSNSFLLLGNGQVLTLEEIGNSPNIRFGGVELITLSACNTAFADETNGKEVDSLAEAIQTKSGKAVLATLWSVADESTSLLMREFYRLRKEDPLLTKAAALQLAQQAMIQGRLRPSTEEGNKRSGITGLKDTKSEPAFRRDGNTPFAHPYFWSPFVLFGNWR